MNTLKTKMLTAGSVGALVLLASTLPAQEDLAGRGDSFTFGYQGFVGAKYALNDSLDLDLSYKLLGTLEHDLGPATVDNTFTHSLLAAITFKF